MSEKDAKPKPKWLEKLKNVKHIEIYIAIIFATILLLIYFSNNKTNDNTTTIEQTNELTVTAYINNIERNLEDILSNIAGVSNVKVMITLDLKNIQVSNSQLTMESFPNIKGVVVTAKGVNNTTNKLKVLHAIEAVIDINNGNIEILSSE